jgi:hypothetical protein
LDDKKQNVYFPLLNNGVTIIARRINPTGNKLLLEDYQIVNGCQTSYVIHENRNAINDSVMIPVRLIATNDDNIKYSIIKATNRQTEVTEDQFFALTDFPKKLEVFSPAFEGKKKLYYERRSRQYNGTPGIEKVRIINMVSLVRAFASMFLTLPHRTTRNYKTLSKGMGKDIFNKEHRLEPYYVSAYAHYRLEYLFRNQSLQSNLKPARYHILLAYRMLIKPEKLPNMNSHEMERYCSVLMENLWDEEQSKLAFERAVDYVKRAAKENLHRDNIRSEPFTDSLLKELASDIGTINAGRLFT